MKISIKILLVILIMSLGSLLIVFGESFYFMNSMVDEFEQANIALGINSSDVTKDSLIDQTEQYLKQLVTKQAQATNIRLNSVNRIVTQSAEYTSSLFKNRTNFVGRDMPRPDQTEAGVACSKYFLVKGVARTPAIMQEVKTLSNCEYAFAPYLDNNDILDNIYIGTKSGISYRYSRSNKYNEDYDPRERDWYKAAMEKPGTLVWLPTYLDSYGNTCITAAMTYNDASGNPIGVVASDILLQDVIDDVMSLRIGQTGSCFLLGSDLSFIAHADMADEGFDPMLENHVSDYDLINQLRSGTDGIIECNYEGKDCYIAFSDLDETGWYFCASIDSAEVTAPAVKAKEESDKLTETTQQSMQDRLFATYRMFMIFFALVGIIITMISFAVSGTITNPIKKLTANVKAIGQGDFDRKIPVDTQDEVGMLAERFNEMQDNLKVYMENITKVTAEKERIGTELSVAAQIQADMLPNIYPAFPTRNDFDIYASMDPAKEVGGDFYDFFLIDDDHLALVMADVSGKGVPAAMFMMMSKILVGNYAMLSSSPADTLIKVNNQICKNNANSMFVTVWLGFLTISTGHVIATNAGHEYPILRKANGEYEIFKDKHKLPVGSMEDTKYQDYEFTLERGGGLFLYTDGVAEATDSDNKLFGTDRMIESLNRHKEDSPRQLLENLRRDVDGFVGDAPQFDDLTMMCVQLK
ncbi:MAG: SpoIIE family protein phosphatase [Lachnospiraceae bacterium]|nr:SpoIIE family protein phosphatase [Lachnospiraceae bacterium]